jgi:hypothetical protein
MKMVKRNYMVLVLLAVVFSLPGIAAYEFYKHPHWLGAAAVNKGKLLNPPELLANINAKPKWRLILWSPEKCEQSCRDQIDKLARIRLALGRRLYEVDELLVVNNKAHALARGLFKSFVEHDINILLISDDKQEKPTLFTGKSQVFIANPDNYLVLAYELDANPADIFHDLQQLLRTTQSKSS